MRNSFVLLTFVFLYTYSQGQNIRYSYDQMENILSFNKYIYGSSETFSMPDDTISFIESILNYYQGSGDEFGFFISFFGKQRPEVKYIDNSTTAYIHSPDSTDRAYRKSFIVLFYIENVILKRSDVAWSIIRKGDNERFINGEYAFYFETPQYFDKDMISHQDFEEKQIRHIYSIYFKWLKALKKTGLKYVRENKIYPLNGTRYSWTTLKVLDYPLEKWD